MISCNLRVILLTLALLAPSVASAWGSQGHRLVAALAWDQLTPHTKAQIEPLLRGEPEPTLSGIASWADELRASDPDLGRRSAAWHYVNIGGGDRCVFVASLDCPEGNCVVAAIPNQATLLADRTQPAAVRTRALKFVVHFIGDIHQPLHAGHAMDKGGNTVQVNLDGKGSNLHRLWDSGLLNTAKLDDEGYLQRLRVTPGHTASMPLSGSLMDRSEGWAEQSCAIVVAPGFYPANAKVGDGYVEQWLPVAEQQLRDGGARLASVLNELFDPRQ